MNRPVEPRRVLVTGATGFLGGNVLAALETSPGVEPIAACRTPSRLGKGFGALMERLHPVLPGSSPFLTRSIVHLANDWSCSGEPAEQKLGYTPANDWRTAVRESLAELKAEGYPWPRLSQDA